MTVHNVTDDTKNVAPATEPAAAAPAPATTTEAPPDDQGIIRGAWLARSRAIASAAETGVGLSAADASDSSLRTAFLTHMSDNRTEAVGGSGSDSGNVLRGVFAARSSATVLIAEAPHRKPGRKAKAKAKPGKAKVAAKAKPAIKPKKAAKAKSAAKAKVTAKAKAGRPAKKKRAAKAAPARKAMGTKKKTMARRAPVKAAAKRAKAGKSKRR